MPARFSRPVCRKTPPKFICGLLLITAASVLGLAAGAFAQQPTKRIPLPMEVPDVVARSQDLGQADLSRILSVAVSMPYADPAGIAAFVDSVSDPANPNYQHFLTPEEVGARFGLSAKQVQSVVDHLTSEGFTVTLVGKNRLSILAEGTVAQAERAFNTSIHEFQTIRNDEPGNSRYFSNTTDPTLPEEIAPYVIDIAGLESFTKPQPRILTPTQTRTLYGSVPMYTAGTRGQGRTVGISNFDGYRLTNVPLYYSQYGLPTPSGGVGTNITVVAVSGGAGAGTAAGEGDLDIQMALGMAPLCNLRIYDGGQSNLIGVLTQEANDNAADVISESYGWNFSTSSATSAHNLHVSMSAQGITYMAASGDSGTTLEPYSYPDYEPEVLQVGGTVASANSAGARVSETGWSGSGGGWSTKAVSFNTLPSWQHATGVPTTNNHRLVPDVALSASGSNGAYYFYHSGSLSSGSVGTSFASPVFAGSLAVAEEQIISQGGLPANAAGKQRFGRIQDLFYSQNQRTDVWFDVTSGSNGALPSSGGTSTAAAGWDYVTGLGAINFNAFVASVVPTCTLPAIASSPTSVAACPGNPATFSVTATGASLTYHWRAGTTSLNDGPTASGSVISGSTTQMLTITGVQSGDAGSYNCLVSNTCGPVQSTGAILAVNSGPMITQQPAAQSLCAGATAAFTFAASGTQAASYQWQFAGGSALTDGPTPTGAVIAGSATGTLTITGVQAGDASTFTCNATNSCGTATSNPVALSVMTGGSITAQPTASQTICPTGAANLSISVSDGNPPLTFQWRWTPQRSGTPVNLVEGVNNDPTTGLPAFTAQGSQMPSLNCTAFSNSYTIGPVMPFTCTVTSPCTNQTSIAASVAICLADFNCSGTTTVQDIFDYLNAWFAGDPRADFNSADGITVGDIFDYLNTWFIGCTAP